MNWSNEDSFLYQLTVEFITEAHPFKVFKRWILKFDVTVNLEQGKNVLIMPEYFIFFFLGIHNPGPSRYRFSYKACLTRRQIFKLGSAIESEDMRQAMIKTDVSMSRLL